MRRQPDFGERPALRQDQFVQEHHESIREWADIRFDRWDDGLIYPPTQSDEKAAETSSRRGTSGVKKDGIL